jgi:hypothetical protein
LDIFSGSTLPVAKLKNQVSSKHLCFLSHKKKYGGRKFLLLKKMRRDTLQEKDFQRTDIKGEEIKNDMVLFSETERTQSQGGWNKKQKKSVTFEE